jgi:hypothetical protein
MSYLALSRADSNHGFAIFLLRIAVFSVAAVIATAGLAHAQCQNDVDGANDEPGQKDITSVCLTPGDGLPYEWEVVTNWDETTLTGANTADVCTLYDINSNSLADLAVCVTLESSGAMNGNLAVFQQFRLYTCGDTRGDRCAGSTQLVGAFTTTCSAAQAASDPFPPAAVNGPGDKFPDDTEIECLIDLDDFGAAGANAELLDACSYPSQQPGSDPSDCILFTQCAVDGDCNDSNVCTTDTCGPGGICVYTPDPGAFCTDGFFCNGDEICNNLGLCENQGPRDCDDGVSCTVDTCDELTAQCINDPRNSLCADASFCNGVELCDQVNDCQAGTPISCDDQISCTNDSCNEVTDSCDNVTDDGLCNDGAFCNGVESCDALAGCQAGTPVACGDGVGCTVDACDEGSDSCTNTADDSLCDDGAFCNGDETCNAISDCQAGTPPDCGDPVGCTIDSCNELTDTCDNLPDDATCDDGAFCNGAEVCDALNDCQAGLAPNCDDGVSCTNDSCNEESGSCDNVSDNSICNDGEFCNGVETCDAVNDCQAGTAPNCDDSVGCTNDACNEVTDSCENSANDALCDNLLFCDGTETCDVNNDCQSGTAPNCDDDVACTIDACNEGSDTCDNTPDNGACGDGLFCTGVEICDPTNDCEPGVDPCAGLFCDEPNDICVGCLGDGDCDNGVFCDGDETCAGGVCDPGTPPNCDDGVTCTDDTCDEANNQCDNVAQDALCDDSQHCNGVETCDSVNDCQAGTAPNCNDAVVCTADSCNEVNDSCDNVADDGACSDGLFCNGTETCNVLTGCEAGAAPDCNDGVGCTTDACDEGGDTCTNVPDDGSCSDGQFCNGVEVCDLTNDCQAGASPACDDGVTCTVDSCDEVGDSCDNAPVDANCDNGLFCDGIETCDALGDCQAGLGLDCDDGVSCTIDACDEGTQACDNTADDAVCDDGLPCNGAETCDSTNDCQPGVPVTCGDGFICSTDTCNALTGACESDFSTCLCGDGEIIPGEDCEPPDTAGTFEDCNNQIDDDGDGNIDCRDLLQERATSCATNTAHWTWCAKNSRRTRA